MLGAARSGWRRGFVFFAIDLVGFIGSVLLAVRFHQVPKALLDVFLSDRWAAFAGGLLIFVPLIVVTATIGSRASRAMYKPGLFTLNRVLGAAVAAVLAMVVALVGLLFLRAAPIPFGIGDLVKRSAVAPKAIELSQPVIASLNDGLGLDLCGGRLARILPEVCPDEKSPAPAKHVPRKSP